MSEILGWRWVVRLDLGSCCICGTNALMGASPKMNARKKLRIE